MTVFRENVISVGTSATQLSGTEYPGYLLKNMSDVTVFIGDGAVTTANGWPLEAGDIFSPSELSHKSLTGRVEDRLRGIVAIGTAEVRVFNPGRLNIP